MSANLEDLGSGVPEAAAGGGLPLGSAGSPFGPSAWRSVGQWRGDGFGRVAIAVLVALLLASVLAPLLAPYSPLTVNVVDRLTGPSGAHWLGTDADGRDVLSRLLYGG